MRIYCTDYEDLVTTIKLLVLEGLTFNSYTETMIIELTGGY
jgi:hypothetical protein